jgi:hypothetical protein
VASIFIKKTNCPLCSLGHWHWDWPSPPPQALPRRQPAPASSLAPPGWIRSYSTAAKPSVGGEGKLPPSSPLETTTARSPPSVPPRSALHPPRRRTSPSTRDLVQMPMGNESMELDKARGHLQGYTNIGVGQLFKYLNMTTIISHNKVVTSVTKNKPAAVSWRCTICDEISCLYVTTKPSRHKIKWLSSNYDDTKIFVIVCYII